VSGSCFEGMEIHAHETESGISVASSPQAFESLDGTTKLSEGCPVWKNGLEGPVILGQRLTTQINFSSHFAPQMLVY